MLDVRNLRRVKGNLLMLRGAPVEEIESCFVKSQEIARQQKSKSLELKACNEFKCVVGAPRQTR